MNVSTRPVVMGDVPDRQLLKVERRLACPCTPTLATRPPGRIRSAQSSNVSGMPTASMATSAPSPSVSLSTVRAYRRAVVDRPRPHRTRAAARGGRGEVDRDDLAGVNRCAVIIAASPIGPAPTIATCRRAAPRRQHPDFVGRREDVGEEDHVLVRQRCPAGRSSTCPRSARCVLGLEPRRSDGRGSSRLRPGIARSRLAAEPAAPAGGDAGDEDAVAGDSPDDRAALGHDADSSCPRILPRTTAGTSPLRMWRSVPQIVEEPISTTTSVGLPGRPGRGPSPTCGPRGLHRSVPSSGTSFRLP